MQSLGLTSTQKAYMQVRFARLTPRGVSTDPQIWSLYPLLPPCQSRIVALHKLIAAEAPRNRWMKPPPGLEPGLVGIDPSLVVQPPAGLELG